MKLSNQDQMSLLSCIALLSTKVLAAASTCVASDVAVITRGTTSPAFFCEFYNARNRKLSPFSALTATKALAACACILSSATPSALTTEAALPQPTQDGVSGTCFAYDMNLVKSNFVDANGFCTFFNAFSGSSLPQIPINGLSVARTNAACTCILDGVVVTAPKHTITTTKARVSTTTTKAKASSTTTRGITTTTKTQTTVTSKRSTTTNVATLAFCSSAPAKSLIADSSSGVPFCQSILHLSTVTDKTTVTSALPATTEVKVSVLTSIVTKHSLVSEVVTTTEGPFDVITSYATYCGNGNMYPHPQKRSAADVKPTPDYLSGRAADYLTSACKCIPHLTAPTSVSTVWSAPPRSTIVSQVVKIVTSEVIIPVTTIDYDSVPGPSTITTTTTITTVSGTLPVGSLYTFTGKASRFGTYVQWTNMALPTPTANFIASCTCDMNVCSANGSGIGKCGTPNSCMDLCDNYNIYTRSICKGVQFNNNTNTCTLYSGSSSLLEGFD
ncbi:hypothetical protein K461DRAFT_316776 [Myriangium duriaei CBS 260.36]|uniref:Apple domain-containing protein n=1 Tax=Myriangium duriaei CBS 260.36 TaxID=1168546 RepID=A0A9P4ITN8_9PEZI|nr:hypothetical protein K461DRAFT_316776 [Myriangium duriaei CBS 260.36]